MNSNPDSNKIRVAFLIDHLDIGGAQIFLKTLCKYFKADSAIDPSVYVLDTAGEFKQDILSTKTPIYHLDVRKKRLKAFKAFFQLSNAFRENRIDIVHSFLQASFLFGAVLAKRNNTAHIHTVVGRKSQTQFWYYPLMNFLQSSTQAFLCGVDFEELKQAGIKEEKIKHVEGVMDLSPFSAIAHDGTYPLSGIDIAAHTPLVLSIGRLHYDKGHDLAIQAWPRVREKFPNACLLIVGDGEELGKLTQLAQKNGPENGIFFTGYRRDLDALFRRADIFLRCSRNEGLNLVTAQAMAAGVPVIGFENVSPKEVVQSGTSGLLVKNSNYEELGNSILLLLENKSMAADLGQNARKIILDYFDIHAIIDFHYKLYRHISNKLPIAQLKDMKEQMWPYKDFHKKDHV